MKLQRKLHNIFPWISDGEAWQDVCYGVTKEALMKEYRRSMPLMFEYRIVKDNNELVEYIGGI